MRSLCMFKNAKVTGERVAVDRNIVTSQGPGTAMEFAFKLVEILFGKDKVREVNKGGCWQGCNVSRRSDTRRRKAVKCGILGGHAADRSIRRPRMNS